MQKKDIEEIQPFFFLATNRSILSVPYLRSYPEECDGNYKRLDMQDGDTVTLNVTVAL